MRVRISFDALRLCALVAAGVTSGYLWRAAFESSSPEDVRTAAKPRVVKPAPSPPVVRIPPRHLTHSNRSAGGRVVTRTVGRPAGRAPATLISSPGVSTPRPRPTPTPPAPTPTPTPTTPAPQSPPPTTTTTPPAQTPSPVASPPTQSVKPPANTPPPTTTTSNADGSRPGWGNGDKNHDHSGPGNENTGNGPKKP